MKSRRSLTSILTILIILLLVGIQMFSSFPGMAAMNDEIDSNPSGGYSYTLRQGSGGYTGNPGNTGLFQSPLAGAGDPPRNSGDVGVTGTIIPPRSSPVNNQTGNVQLLSVSVTLTTQVTVEETPDPDGNSVAVPEYPSSSMAVLLTGIITALACLLVHSRD